MLRIFLLVVGLGMLLVGLGARLSGHPEFTSMIVIGAVVVLAVLFERWRYRPRTRGTRDEWVRTDERFIDPGSGRPMDVLFNPRTGERRYVGSSDDGAS